MKTKLNKIENIFLDLCTTLNNRAIDIKEVAKNKFNIEENLYRISSKMMEEIIKARCFVDILDEIKEEITAMEAELAHYKLLQEVQQLKTENKKLKKKLEIANSQFGDH